MVHTAVSATLASSVTLKIWRNEAKVKNCNFATFTRIFDKKNLYYPNRARYIKLWLENDSRPIKNI